MSSFAYPRVRGESRLLPLGGGMDPGPQKGIGKG